MTTTAVERGIAFIQTQATRQNARLRDASGQLLGARAEMLSAGAEQQSALPAGARVHARAGQWIAFSGEEMNRWTLELLNLERPAVAKAFVEVQVPVAEHAIQQWPRRTGFSADALGMHFQYQAGEASSTFYGVADYTYVIHYSIHREARRTRDVGYLRAIGGRLQQLGGATELNVARVAKEFRTTADVVRTRTALRSMAVTKNPVYRLPSGAPASGGERAWTVQVYTPGLGGLERMAEIVADYWRAA